MKICAYDNLKYVNTSPWNLINYMLSYSRGDKMDSLFEFESKRTHKMLREQARKSILTNPYIYLLYMVGLTIMFYAIL